MDDRTRTIVLVHGVGIGPASMQPLAAHLAAAGRPTLVVDRPGYGGAAHRPPTSVSGQAALVLAALDDARLGVVDVVGVSGGATVGLALSLLAPDRCGRVVLHEPLVGRLAPRLHAAIEAAAHALAADPTVDGAVGFVRALVGLPTWDSLDPAVHQAIAEAAPVIRAEVPHFAAWAPTPEELRTLDAVELVTTWGSARPAPERAEAADVLARHAGAEVVEIERAGHLAHVDRPAELAAVVLSRRIVEVAR